VPEGHFATGRFGDPRLRIKTREADAPLDPDGELYREVLDRLRDPRMSVQDVMAVMDLTVTQVVGVLCNDSDPQAVKLREYRLARAVA
jgi:hypothetical protein